MLEHRLHLSRMADHDAAAALLLRGLMELCVYPPQDPRTGGESGGGGSGGGAGADHLPVSWSCTDDAVSMVIHSLSVLMKKREKQKESFRKRDRRTRTHIYPDYRQGQRPVSCLFLGCSSDV